MPGRGRIGSGCPADGRRREFIAGSVLGGATLGAALVQSVAARDAHAQTALRPGTDYRVLPAAQPAPADRIEVLEFFYYGCPFCFQLEPMLLDWLKRQPADVAFDRVPVIGRDSWAPLARLYYVLAELGAVDVLHSAAYRAVHNDGLLLGQADVATDWAVRSGLDRARFVDAWRLPKIDTLVARARRMTDDYDIQATPSIIVDGRLLTSSGLTNGVPPLLPVVDRLIVQARAERARVKPV
jgi:thiol:disulfide interchange protein DsbA